MIRMKESGRILLLCAALLLGGCAYIGQKEKTQEVQEKEVTSGAEIIEKNEEAESEQTMNEHNIIRIEEIQQLPAGAIVTDAQLKTIVSENFFYKESITDSLFERIYGKSYKENCTIPREELTYLRLLHMGFDGETHIGEIMVNQEIAEDVLDIFEKLYEAGYPIEKVQLIDEYDADDEASMGDNNTSAFNYRTISHSDKLSNHSYGKALDINPRYNPYVKAVNGSLSCEPDNGRDYMDRAGDFPYKIDENDLCYQLFTKHGFTWGGDWSYAKDYQHFEK